MDRSTGSPTELIAIAICLLSPHRIGKPHEALSNLQAIKRHSVTRASYSVNLLGYRTSQLSFRTCRAQLFTFVISSNGFAPCLPLSGSGSSVCLVFV